MRSSEEAPLRAGQGYVMQLQPFSVNDGDGIRTTVFLAGCPLRCRWCSNPEGLSARPLVGWYRRKCTGCGLCADACPEKIGIDLDLGRDRCRACGACADVCPSGARARLVRPCGAEEILGQIRKHEIFYRYSGGGITFSGGEATAQPAFLDELTARIYDMGLPMALETCGQFDFDCLRPTLERFDLIFMDLKLMDDEKHRRYTGASNARILENIGRLAELPADVVIRIPVVGGVNDDEENVRRSAAYVHAHLPKARMELLPYHALGKVKYEALGLAYPQDGFTTPTEEALRALEEVVRAEGVPTVRFR